MKKKYCDEYRYSRKKFDEHFIRKKQNFHDYVCANFWKLSQLEDVLSDFYLYWIEKEKFLNEDSFKDSYLLASLRNYCINRLKKHRNEISYLELNEANFVQDINDSNEHLISKAIKLIDKLPERCRKILIVSKANSMTFCETGKELNISINTVKSQMKIAKRKLKEQLSE